MSFGPYCSHSAELLPLLSVRSGALSNSASAIVPCRTRSGSLAFQVVSPRLLLFKSFFLLPLKYCFTVPRPLTTPDVILSSSMEGDSPFLFGFFQTHRMEAASWMFSLGHCVQGHIWLFFYLHNISISASLGPVGLPK